MVNPFVTHKHRTKGDYMTDLKLRKIELAVIIGLIFSMLLTPIMAFGKDCSQLHDSVLRLHILASSDSDADQNLKYVVRDAILGQSVVYFDQITTIGEATVIAESELSQIEDIANTALAKAGSTQTATAQIVATYFDTRFYTSDVHESFTMPAGEYNALQVTIGEGAGENWWCVMFPPMCVSAAVKPTEATQVIEDINTRPKYEMAFATVEMVEEIVAACKKAFQ